MHFLATRPWPERSLGALYPLLSLPSPISLSTSGGFGCDTVQVPRQEPLGLAASLLFTEEVVEGVACFG